MPALVVAAWNRLVPASLRGAQYLAVGALLISGFVVARGAYERPSAAWAPEFADWRLGRLAQITRWLDTNVQGVRVAYTGNNVPYFLLGRRLENAAFYVNTDRHRDWDYHDYEKHYRERRTDPFTPEPAYFRMELDEEAWIENLKESGAQFLFASNVLFKEHLNIRHSSDGRVIEEHWRRAALRFSTACLEQPGTPLRARFHFAARFLLATDHPPRD